MTMQDKQDEVAAILAQIAMIAKEVNLLALEGSGVGRSYHEQLAFVAEVKLRGREMLALCDEAHALCSG